MAKYSRLGGRSRSRGSDLLSHARALALEEGDHFGFAGAKGPVQGRLAKRIEQVD